MIQYTYYAATVASRSTTYSTKEGALKWAHNRLAHRGARHIKVFLQVGGVDYLLETIHQSTATIDTYRAIVVQGNAASFTGATRTEATQWGLDRRVFDGANVVDIYLEIEGNSYFIDRLLDPKVWRYQAMVADGGNLALADTSPQYLTPEEAIEWGEAELAEGVGRVIVYLLKENTMVEHTILLPK